MKFFTTIQAGLFAFVLFIFSSCDEKTEQIDTYDYEPDRLTELVPLQTGKYITYRLDSMVFPNFGRSTEIHKYQVKHIVDAQIPDNLGRPSYRIFRYIRDEAGVNPWAVNGSYFITVTDKQIEVVEDNLRFVRLRIPVRDGNTWKGNAYLPEDPYDYINPNNTYDANIADWNFYIDGDMKDETIGSATVKDVRTVAYDIFKPSVNEKDNRPIVDTSFATKLFALDKYAKNIGLVYREYTLWEHQNNVSGAYPNQIYDPYTVGFSIKMWMIDHN